LDTKPTVTFDTSCIYSNEDEKAPRAIRELERIHAEGRIQIVKTDVLDTELGEGNEQLKLKSEEYSEDFGVMVADLSRADHAVAGGSEIDYLLEQIRDTVFRNLSQMSKKSQARAIRDAMHLATHRMYKRHFFVTRDQRHIIYMRKELEEKFGIVALTPEECLARLKPSLDSVS